MSLRKKTKHLKINDSKNIRKKINKRIKIVLVEPLYQINLGYMARTLKNFGIEKLYLVNPRCNYKGKEAIKYSKHAKELLLNAKLYSNIKEAIKSSDIVFGSTGAWYKCDSSFFNLYSPSDAANFAKSKQKITILIGRDDTGLTKDELKLCDGIIFIPTNSDYSVLNISHALAIILYEFTSKFKYFEYPLDMFYATNKDLKNIINLFKFIIKKRTWIRDKEGVLMAFKHILKRSKATKKEINAITVGLSQNKISDDKNKFN
jgi:tRNA/rRNA methyltransferase